MEQPIDIVIIRQVTALIPSTSAILNASCNHESLDILWVGAINSLSISNDILCRRYSNIKYDYINKFCCTILLLEKEVTECYLNYTN